MNKPNTVKKCKRETCKFHTHACVNCCSALSDVYENSKKCSFFKKKEVK